MNTNKSDKRSKRLKFGLILATTSENCFNTFAPLGIGYLASSIRKKLPNVDIIFSEDIDTLIKNKPDIIGISSSSDNYYIAIEFAEKVKASIEIPVVIGGIHISLLPESLHDTFDIGVIGEAEVTMVELLESFLLNGSFEIDSLHSIKGLVFKSNDELIITAPREIINDLDSLPQPVIEELPYFNPSPTNAVCLISSRGCPYKCSFCCSRKFSKTYRAFSPDVVVNLIDYWVNTKNFKHIILYDDLLIANKKRFLKIIELLEERQIPEKCVFNCQVRANLIDDEICHLLKRMNVVEVGMGVESFCDKTLFYYNKAGCSGQINQLAIDCLHKHNIDVGPGIIFGAPEETKEDMLVTLRAIYSNFASGKIKKPGWGVLRPFPGTKIWEYALEKGIVSPQMDWKMYTADLYLDEVLPRSEFIELIQEWKTKNTILLLDKPGFGGNFIFDEIEETYANAKYFYEHIKRRKERELGDDCITGFIEKSIPPRLIKGYYKGPNEGEHWVSGNSTVLVKYDEEIEITLEGKFLDIFFKPIFDGEVEVSVLLPDQSVLANVLVTEKDYTSGEFNLVFILPSTSFTSFQIISSKSCVPKLIGLSEDERELSFVLKNIYAKSLHQSANSKS